MGLTPSLLVLVGALAFTVGFFIGAQVFAAVLRARERRLVRERRAINEVRRYLRQRHGVELPAWIAAAIDKERPKRRRPQHRRKS